MEPVQETGPIQISAGKPATIPKFVLILFITFLLATLLLAGIYLTKSGFFGFGMSKSAFSVSSQIPGVKIVMTKDAENWYQKALKAAGFQKEELAVYGTQVRVVPKRVEFVFSELKTLTDEEVNNLFFKVFGQSNQLITGARNELVGENVIRTTIFVDSDFLPKDSPPELERILTKHLFFYLQTLNPRYKPGKMDILANTKKVEQWKSPIIVR